MSPTEEAVVDDSQRNHQHFFRVESKESLDIEDNTLFFLLFFTTLS
jgi:hypothetical protein